MYAAAGLLAGKPASLSGSVIAEAGTGTLYAQFESGNNPDNSRALLWRRDTGIRAYEDVTASLVVHMTGAHWQGRLRVPWSPAPTCVSPCTRSTSARVCAADLTSSSSSFIIGFTDMLHVWAVSVTSSSVYPVQGLYSDPFVSDASGSLNPFRQQACTDKNNVANVTFHWNRADRSISVVFARGVALLQYSLAEQDLPNFPADTLSVLAYATANNDVLQYYNAFGFVRVVKSKSRFGALREPCLFPALRRWW